MGPIKLTQWLAAFCMWHEAARKGELSPELLPHYLKGRADLSALLVTAQRLEIRTGGQTTRQAVRVARAMPVEFDVDDRKIVSLTQDLSVSGLSALVGETPAVGTTINFRLKPARGVEVTGLCRVVAAIQLQGSVRMAVAFEALSVDGREQIEMVVFDAVCAEIRVLLRGQLLAAEHQAEAGAA
jgi:hypothetical protein